MIRAARQTALIAQRSITRALRVPTVLLAIIALPVALLWLLCQIFGALPNALASFPTATYQAFITPAICMAGVLPCAIAGGVGLQADLRCGLIEHLQAAPVSRGALFLGDALAVAAGAMATCLVVLAGSVAGGLPVAAGLAAVPALLALGTTLALTYCGLSFLLSQLATGERAQAFLGAGVLIATLIASEALLPARLLPGWLVLLSQANPLTYALRGARAVLWAPASWETLTHNLLIMVLLAALGMGSAFAAFQRHGRE